MYSHIKNLKCVLGFLLLAMCMATQVWAGKNSGGSTSTTTQIYDTSFAVEYSYSCLSGGCHETNTTLLNGYKASYMTHVMVKCNACHGTHTAAEVGQVKPDLTGYTSSSGVTGYKVPKDRCLVCHTAVLTLKGHPNNPSDCISCHTPHEFHR